MFAIGKRYKPDVNEVMSHCFVIAMPRTKGISISSKEPLLLFDEIATSQIRFCGIATVLQVWTLHRLQHPMDVHVDSTRAGLGSLKRTGMY